MPGVGNILIETGSLQNKIAEFQYGEITQTETGPV